MNSFDPDQVRLPGNHFIVGGIVAGKGPEFDVTRPSDGKIYARLRAATNDEIDEAVESARTAFRTSGWATMPPRKRAAILRRWADMIDADVAMLAPLEAVGSTRTLAEATSWDVPFTAEGIRFFAEFADKLGGDVAATGTDMLGMVISEPIGVIGAIAPWNFPLVMACWKIAPALAAGNSVVLKPSEMTPFSAVRLAELAIAAGMPAGIFNVVQGGGREGDALCRHPRIAKVTFTGSTRTGAAIMTACAQSGPKPVTLELGGKSPQLVFADAPDFEHVVATIARAITSNSGQVCVAGSRLIVQDQMADRLVARLAELFGDLQAGPTWDTDTSLSPIISRRQCDRIDGIVQRSRADGAAAVTGGGHADGFGDGAYYQPTILAGVTGATEAVRDEVFGPVITVQTFHDEEEGFSLAGHPSYGLAAGVYTRDIARALRAMRRLEAGTVWVNRYGRTEDFILPTGGYKQSGIGKDLGRQAFEASLRFKSVLIGTT